MQDGKVRMSRSWLMYDKGGNSWVLAGDDVVWATSTQCATKLTAS